MIILLFLLYILVVSLFFKKIQFFKNSGLSSNQLFFLFLIKVIIGILYGIYFSSPNQILKADTWTYFYESKKETLQLLNNPISFFSEIFKDQSISFGNFFASTNSFWNNLKSISFIKFLVVLNLFTNSNYYLDVLLINFIFMFGYVALFRLLNENYLIKKNYLILTVFLIPSNLFWCSSLHKDGIIFSMSVFLVYLAIKFYTSPITVKRVLLFISCVLVVFLLRNFFLLVIIPPIIGLIISGKTKLNPKLTYSVIFSIIISFCLLGNKKNSMFNIVESIVEKNKSFKMHSGSTKFENPNLEENLKSIINYLPFAIANSLLRPYPRINVEIEKQLATAENFFILTLFLIASYHFIRNPNCLNVNIILALLMLSLIWYLFIGYTVCFEGAIVRYKSVVLPFFVSSCIILIFGKKLTRLDTKKLI